jgi:geranylgeranyl diphosphate synthase, type II
MDDDTLRRGRPTSHVVFGEGLAILAGDGLLTEAFALLAREPAADGPSIAERKLKTIGVIAHAAGAVGMVGGQAVDLDGGGRLRRHPSTAAGPARARGRRRCASTRGNSRTCTPGRPGR